MGDWLGSPGGAADLELERALESLAHYVAYPPTPDIAGRVRIVIARDPVVHQLPDPNARRRGPLLPAESLATRLGILAACLVVAVIVGLTIAPEMRTAIAERLGLRGIHIAWIDDAPTPLPSPVGAALALGHPATLAEAQAAVEFPVLMPTAAGLPSPPEIYVSGEDAAAMISFVYPEAPGLPAANETGVGALLTQFAGRTERSLIEKGLQSPGGSGEPRTRLEPVTVRGEPGFWITGAPHAVYFICSGPGECRQEPYRLAGDVLLWEHGNVTLRLESGLSRDAALVIAESVRSTDELTTGTSTPAAR